MQKVPDAPLPLVDVESLTVRPVLEGVCLRVEPGTIHVLAGPNGGGKTTLLRSILGQAAFEGSIRCHWRREGRIGYVPQALDLDRELPMTAAEFLALEAQRRPVCLGIGGPARDRVDRALALVGMTDRSSRRLGVLSGGELRRVLLARALVPTPELLLLDEPTAGVDEEGLRSLEATLLRLKKEERVTTLLVSHDPDHSRRIADRVTWLNRTVLRSGTAEEVLR